MDFSALVAQCSPSVPLAVASSIVRAESGFNPYAINVNNSKPIKQPRSYANAVATAKRLLVAGKSLDLGIAQINSKNLKWLKLSVEQAFKPCHNLKAMQTVYLACNKKAGKRGYGTRMQRTLSCYNTGNVRNGFRNGYVAKTTRFYNQYAAQKQQYRQPLPVLPRPITARKLPKNSQALAAYAQDLQTQPSKVSVKRNIRVNREVKTKRSGILSNNVDGLLSHPVDGIFSNIFN